MWDVIFDIVLLQVLDFLPRPVRIGCFAILGLAIVSLLLWFWLR